MLHLLRLLGYPQMDDVQADLHQGFAVIGQLNKGVDWQLRTDDWYNDQMSTEEFATTNNFIIIYLLTRQPDEYCDEVLAEILAEVKMGRVEGPFEAPAHWPQRTVAPPGHELLRLRAGRILVAPVSSASTK